MRSEANSWRRRVTPGAENVSAPAIATAAIIGQSRLARRGVQFTPDIDAAVLDGGRYDFLIGGVLASAAASFFSLDGDSCSTFPTSLPVIASTFTSSIPVLPASLKSKE